MGQTFKNIDYPKSLYESVRNYFAVNTSNEITILYKYLACFLEPLIGPFDEYVLFRTRQALIAQCKWQIGQLTNLLNYLYDSTLNRIFITQSQILALSAPKFAYTTLVQLQGFGVAAQGQVRKFGDQSAISDVVIHVPVSVNLSSITAVIEQIRVQGIPYQIVTF